MILDLPWTRTWWSYRPGDPSDIPARSLAFNLPEAAT
jgi:hypothetical protein